ncbi:MAG: RNA polymerase sigma factor [Pseudomonadota bacterium]
MRPKNVRVARVRQEKETIKQVHRPADPKNNSQKDAGKTDDAAALEAIYADYHADLTRYLRKAFGDGPPDPEDVAQEAFARLADQKDLSLIDNLRGFLWRTARNLTISDKRRNATRTRFDYEVEHLYFAVSSPECDPSRVIEVREQLKIIRAVLDQMPERRRKAFLWQRIDGLSFTDIGKKLGIDRRAVVRHISIAATDIEIALAEASEVKR